MTNCEERCENCKFFHTLEYGFEVNKGFKYSNCCTVLIQIAKDGENPFVTEVQPNDRCEMFTNKYRRYTYDNMDSDKDSYSQS